MRLPNLFRTTAFRLALGYIGLFAISTLLLFGLVYWSIREYAEDQLRDSIEVESAALTATARLHGFDAAVAMVQGWIERDEDRPADYLLLDASGEKRAGDLEAFSARTGWQEFIGRDDDGDQEHMVGLGVRLPSGELLLVAQDTSDLRELQETVTNAFALAGGVSLLLAVIGGLITSALFLRRIEGFNRTAARIIDGRLTERVPVRGTNDEFDRLATNLNAMLDRIQALMESMRQVSSDVAHDLRTPLTRLRQQLETALHDASDTEARERAVQRAIEECDQILSTFSALVRIAQIESGSRRAGFAPVDLSALCDSLAETYGAVAEDNRQTLISQLAPGIHTIGDRELMTQLFANLIENGIRHTPPGSTIHFSLREDRGTGPVVRIADNGPGIPPEERQKVFRRFYRLEASRTTPGSGLGLSMVAAIAELHGITVELDDAQPGLAVTLRFPRARRDHR